MKWANDFVSGTFSGNVAEGAYQAQGGAIYHKGKGNGENAEALVLKNASFYGNRAVSAAEKLLAARFTAMRLRLRQTAATAFLPEIMLMMKTMPYMWRADILNFQLKIREKSRWMTVLTVKTII